MSKYMINLLEWDSNFFGINCGKVIIENSDYDIKKLSRELKEYEFVSIQNIGNDIGVNKDIAIYTKAFLADINVQFVKKLTTKEDGINTGDFLLIKSRCLPEEIRVEMLVEESDFKFSKFVCDPELKKRNGFLVYKEWIKNACKDDDKYFLIFKEKSTVGAYILFSIRDKCATIELVKVNNEYKGKHIASKMIKTVELFLFDMGVTTLIVGTQFNNIPAMNLYHSLGFKEISRTSVFHYWNALE